jgi:hypothetical protein
MRISGSSAGYTMFRGHVKSTGYPLHSSVSSSLPFPCVTVCHYISTGLYFIAMEAETVLCELHAEAEEKFVKIETLFSAQCLLKLKK